MEMQILPNLKNVSCVGLSSEPFVLYSVYTVSDFQSFPLRGRKRLTELTLKVGISQADLQMKSGLTVLKCSKFAGTIFFLREKLRPYLKGLMAEAHTKGSPVMRAVFYEYPKDPKAWNIEDEFMLGSSILVAPITEQGARSRKVYLPAGEWTELFSGKSYQGGKVIEAHADLSQIPVFIRDKNLFLDAYGSLM